MSFVRRQRRSYLCCVGGHHRFRDSGPKRLRASGREGGHGHDPAPSPLRMLLSRHTSGREFTTQVGDRGWDGNCAVWAGRREL
jgi:hypothetical protein